MMLSVVVPVYNVEQYLEKCVGSVLQMKTDLEIILVDDGSTDNSGKLCDSWAERDSRIKVIHQKNGGLSVARNTGIRNSSGQFVMFLDSDDYLDPEETERMLEELTEGTDVLMGLYRQVYGDDDPGIKEKSQGFLAIRGLVDTSDFLSALPIDGQDCYMTAWRFVCRRSFLLENDLYFMTGIYHEDEEWSQRLFFSAAGVYVTHYYFYQYRQARPGSITASVKPKRIYDRFAIIHNGMELIQTAGVSAALRDYIHKQSALIYYANLVDYRILDEDAKRTIWPQYVQFQYLLNYQNNQKGKMIKVVWKLFGLKAVCRFLSILRTVKSAIS